MTREYAKQLILKASKDDKSSPKNCIHLLSLHAHIEKIYDDFEAQLKTKDEEIERLKAENKKYMEHITLKHLSEPIVFCASCSEKVIMLKDNK